MLSIKNLSKTYRGGKKAVSNLNLEIEAGDIYGFIGHNGAGKTTTIKAIAGILSFESGDILIDGISIKENPLIGIFVNLSFPVFDWDNEVSVVKQSAAMFISLIIGMISFIIPTAAVFIFKEDGINLISISVIIIMAVLSAVFYRKSVSKDLLYVE